MVKVNPKGQLLTPRLTPTHMPAPPCPPPKPYHTYKGTASSRVNSTALPSSGVHATIGSLPTWSNTTRPADEPAAPGSVTGTGTSHESPSARTVTPVMAWVSFETVYWMLGLHWLAGVSDTGWCPKGTGGRTQVTGGQRTIKGMGDGLLTQESSGRGIAGRYHHASGCGQASL